MFEPLKFYCNSLNHRHSNTISTIARPVNEGDSQNLWSTLYSIQLLSVLRKHLVIGQFNFSSVFLCFSLVTINWQTSYDSCVLRQDYGIWSPLIGTPRMSPVYFGNRKRFADGSYEVCRLGRHLGSTFGGRTVHSCGFDLNDLERFLLKTAGPICR